MEFLIQRNYSTRLMRVLLDIFMENLNYYLFNITKYVIYQTERFFEEKVTDINFSRKDKSFVIWVSK